MDTPYNDIPKLKFLKKEAPTFSRNGTIIYGTWPMVAKSVSLHGMFSIVDRDDLLHIVDDVADRTPWFIFQLGVLYIIYSPDEATYYRLSYVNKESCDLPPVGSVLLKEMNIYVSIRQGYPKYTTMDKVMLDSVIEHFLMG